MEFSQVWLTFCLTALVCLPIVFIIANNKKKKIGNIHCNRCNYEGPAQSLVMLFRPVKFVCKKCQSEDWVVIKP